MRDVRLPHLRALTRRCVSTLLITLIALACSPDSLVGNGQLPPNITDPAVTHTPAGAMNAYRGAVAELSTAFAGFIDRGIGIPSASVVMTTGLLSDELQSGEALGSPRGTIPGVASVFVDSRTLPENTDPVTEPQSTYQATYRSLQKARGQANEAAGLLAAYVPSSARTLTGHLETMQGYAELMLADVFCSGIPLSTVDFNGDYTLQSGSSTQEVYEHAITLFDSALVAAADSARVVNLARVGRGRALLDLGRYAEAAQAVADVPDGFQYLETYSTIDQSLSGDRANFAASTVYPWVGSVSDREGGHGLDFITSGDPRVGATPTGGTNPYGFTIEVPIKYAPAGDTPVVLADWIEARLIQAEAQLHAGDIPAWLGTLNHLRETAITPAIADTTDPIDADARVNLHFRERAFWLFLTGHRLGDLRRLVRQYGRNASAVFPNGPYSGANGSYGTDVNAPIPAAERAYNPRFTGCINRGA